MRNLLELRTGVWVWAAASASRYDANANGTASSIGFVKRVGLTIVRYQRDKYSTALENRLYGGVHTSVPDCCLIVASSESKGGKPHSSGTKTSRE